jgi:hypothetical protein
MAVHTGPDGSYNITAVDHTQVYLDNVTSIGTGANRAAGAATVTLGATFDASVAWTSIGTDISN